MRPRGSIGSTNTTVSAVGHDGCSWGVAVMRASSMKVFDIVVGKKIVPHTIA